MIRAIILIVLLAPYVLMRCMVVGDAHLLAPAWSVNQGTTSIIQTIVHNVRGLCLVAPIAPILQSASLAFQDTF